MHCLGPLVTSRIQSNSVGFQDRFFPGAFGLRWDHSCSQYWMQPRPACQGCGEPPSRVAALTPRSRTRRPRASSLRASWNSRVETPFAMATRVGARGTSIPISHTAHARAVPGLSIMALPASTAARRAVDLRSRRIFASQSLGSSEHDFLALPHFWDYQNVLLACQRFRDTR